MENGKHATNFELLQINRLFTDFIATPIDLMEKFEKNICCRCKNVTSETNPNGWPRVRLRWWLLETPREFGKRKKESLLPMSIQKHPQSLKFWLRYWMDLDGTAFVWFVWQISPLLDWLAQVHQVPTARWLCSKICLNSCSWKRHRKSERTKLVKHSPIITVVCSCPDLQLDHCQRLEQTVLWRSRLRKTSIFENIRCGKIDWHDSAESR